MKRVSFFFWVLVLIVSVVGVSWWFVSLGTSASHLRSLYATQPENWPQPTLDAGVELNELGALPPMQTVDDELANLGKHLFFDPRLSKSGQISCASCHDPQLAWADGRRFAFGHDRAQGNRNTMSLFNIGLFNEFFWDGRVSGLAKQALVPIENPIEMNAKLSEVLEKLNATAFYQSAFQTVFPQEPHITAEMLGQALAGFEMTIRSRKTRFDRFVEGDYKQLSDQEIQGLHLFRTKGRCLNCHSGALFSDQKYHNTGLSYFGRKYQDLGRYEATQLEADKGKFKTPSLRNITLSSPYMHNGLFPHLRGVLNMYNHGMTVNKKLKPGEPAVTSLIRPLKLTRKELEALESFLEAISSESSGYVSPPNF
ncbi:hypothetical protein AVO42_08695 [Thiomicrospira sp. XS5]|uniref:cytochrome-c peroxidase n=1 Tax=Thiomicrospira sp. XS5 TaxID=1775636 RepID=UPI000747744A|nr:cytochrome c peroxidase [Thiomicrospira sp. XS5]KUJ75394.1 hypothetical protein AVO42_08695 [Thiomicrospira sp. XS5]